MSIIIDWLRQIVGFKSHKNQVLEDTKSCCGKTITSVTNSEPQLDLKIDDRKQFDIKSSTMQTADEKITDTSFNILLNSFLEQFQFNSVVECPFIYQEGNSQTFECVLWASKLATRHYQVKNLFPDDETVVYFTTISRDNPALISFMDFALKKAMCIESFSVFGSNGNMILSELCSTTTSKNRQYCNEIKLFQDNALQYMSENQFQDFIRELHDFFRTKLYEPYKIQYRQINADFNLDTYRKLCERMNIEASDAVRWKKEFNLYNLVKKHYSDAIFQFRAAWLGQQSLDIFIPSINLGIEYQGIQHYESVELFGGKEELQTRIINDEKKKTKCQKNNVMLLEWPYIDEVSEGNLQIKFQNLGLQTPSAEIITISESDMEAGAAPVQFLSETLDNKNLAKILYSIEEMARNNDRAGIRDALCDAIINFSEHRVLLFFKNVLRYDSPAIYDAICSDEKLVEYWTHTGILNYYGRKIVFTLEHKYPGSDVAAYYLKKTRNIEKKRGGDPDIRHMNNIIKNEAQDNGIALDRIRNILSKSY